MGMIAQDVEKVVPEWVGIDNDGYKTLGFIGFEALTVEAMRELRTDLQKQIDELKKENKEQQQIENLMKTVR